MFDWQLATHHNSGATDDTNIRNAVFQAPAGILQREMGQYITGPKPERPKMCEQQLISHRYLCTFFGFKWLQIGFCSKVNLKYPCLHNPCSEPGSVQHSILIGWLSTPLTDSSDYLQVCSSVQPSQFVCASLQLQISR